VEEVILGPNGVLEGAHPGALIIDMSSINPLVSQKIATEVSTKNVGFLDAPVSGGEPRAIDGTLAIMVGGSEHLYDLAEPLLKCLGATVTHMGPVGAGNVTKLANQIIVACNIAAVGEALTLSTRCGLDPQVVVSAIKSGLAGSAVLNAKGPTIIARNFDPGFKLRLHGKDLRNALLTAEANDVKLPITAELQQMLLSLVDKGMGELDHSAIVTYTEALSGVEISSAYKNV
jgi:2-hydroxy-3-oxopropionate reductase